MEVRYPILGFSPSNCTGFVEFWEKLYSGFDEEFYQKNIGQELTEDLIVKWFTWKNGSPLSAPKADTVRTNFIANNECVEHDANTEKLARFLNKPGGAIWRVFWLHLHHSHDYPIYDQHVHRAMAFMLDWRDRDREIPASNRAKIQTYLEKYRPFFGSFASERRKVDRALWSFGRFLKTHRNVIECLKQA